MRKVEYLNPQQVSREKPEANLDKWFVAYEDMWRLIKAGHTQTEIIDHISKEWPDGEVGTFLQWVRFYEGEDDKRYASDINSSFLKVAISMPGISLRNNSLQEMIADYKRKMFSRLKALRALVEEAVFKLPDDLVMDHNQVQKATQLIGELSNVIRNLSISRADSPAGAIARLKTIEDMMCKIGLVMSNKSNPLVKFAESSNKEDILDLLQSAHKNFVEKPSVRELALAFAKDSLGQFPDIGQALAKMIEAHNYVTPRIEEIMSNISVQLGTELQKKPRGRDREEPRETSREEVREPEAEPQDIQVKMPEGTEMPRTFNR